jgi:hypothetical protein
MKLIKMTDKKERRIQLTGATVAFGLGMMMLVSRFIYGYAPSEIEMSVGIASTLPHLAAKIGDNTVCVIGAVVMFGMSAYAMFHAFFEFEQKTR